MPTTRRRPEAAFWAKSRISTRLCTGSMSRLTRNRKARSTPALTPRPAPRNRPPTTTPAVRAAANSSAVEKRVLPKAAVRNSTFDLRSSAARTRCMVAPSMP